MSNQSDLESRIRVLEDTEAIKTLKFKYWDSVDRKQWECLAGCFTEDVVFDTPQFGRMEGRNFIVKVLQRTLRNAVTVHHGHNPEIEITGDTTARGRWALNDRVELPDKKFFRGYGHYDEEYIKENGQWKILSSKLTYSFQESSPEIPASK